MYLDELNCWNFRKYGTDEIAGKPSVTVKFNRRLNLLVGENDSGKTTIIDAIKFVLGTQSYDTLRIDENDFFKSASGKRETELKIECIFKDLSDKEAGQFIEWINFDTNGNVELRVRIVASIKNNKITYKRTAGLDGLDINFEASELLRITYLKPLRDAEHELSPGYRSRFAQVLKSHPIFATATNENHELVSYMKAANANIERYFEVDRSNDKDAGGVLVHNINQTLQEFIGIDNSYRAKVNISDIELSKILNKLMLSMDDNKIGLGSLNQLYIAMELLLLEIKSQNNEYGMALIEEIEAHLHPQAQLRIIKYLQNKIAQQIILTTHSITLASSVDLQYLIMCKNGKAYSMGSDYTQLGRGDYEFLQRFLDSTKSNLFFAKGVILVEGDAENILIPAIAEIIGYPLYKYGISIVNVGNTAFLRYSKVFIRKGSTETLGIPVSIVTDLDVRPPEYYNDTDNQKINISPDNATLVAADSIDEEGMESGDMEDTFQDKKSPYLFYRIKGIDGLEDDSFLTEREVKLVLRKELGLQRINQSTKEQYIDEINDYTLCKEQVRKNKEVKYNNEKIKVFINTWTLEYDLALSSIRDYVLAAINIAVDINISEDIIQDIDLDRYIYNAKQIIEELIYDGKSYTEIAYLIYKPLLRGKGSKAITAQYLAKILEVKFKDGSINEQTLIDNRFLSYIIRAIKHATCLKEEIVND